MTAPMVAVWFQPVHFDGSASESGGDKPRTRVVAPAVTRGRPDPKAIHITAYVPFVSIAD
jgi:hypothetical protein